MAAYEFDGEKYKQASMHQKEWGNNLIETFSNPQQSWGESCTQVAINGVAK